jgi:hypothetical protein
MSGDEITGWGGTLEVLRDERTDWGEVRCQVK